MKIPFVRNRRFYREAGQFVKAQADKGVILQDKYVPEKLYAVKAIVVDASLLLQGRNVVQRLAAPLNVCPPERFKHQRAWMVLTAGISLGCGGYGPLERFVSELNFSPQRMSRQYPRIAMLPYDAKRQMETTIHRDGTGFRAYAKGDTEAVLACCMRILDGGERLLEEKDRVSALKAAETMEAQGLDTLAFATRWMQDTKDAEQDMTFLGIVGMGDLPTEEGPWTMSALREGEIRPILVSSGGIASGVARSSGMARAESRALDADEMDRMTDEMLAAAALEADIYMGVDKLRRQRLLRALEADGPVAVLSILPEGTGLSLTLGLGRELDVVVKTGGLPALVRMFGECRSLCEGFSAEKEAERAKARAEAEAAEAAEEAEQQAAQEEAEPQAAEQAEQEADTPSSEEEQAEVPEPAEEEQPMQEEPAPEDGLGEEPPADEPQAEEKEQ